MDTRPVYVSTSKPAVLGSHGEALEIARSLGADLRSRIAETESLRRLPDASVAQILESGLYGLMVPKRYGGSELGAESMIDVTVELASQCASTGWVYMLWTAHMWMLALFGEQAQDEMWKNPNTLASSCVSTTGDVIRVEGGYSWTGKGFFSSGVDHCNWLTAAVPVKGKEGEEPERIWMLIPREDFEIIDDWNAIGLKGTGSKTVVFNDIFVPDYRVLKAKDAENGTSPGALVNRHPMYRGISHANFTAAMAAPAIGAAKGFLSLFEDRLRAKAGPPAGLVNSPYLPGGLGTTIARYSHAAAQVDALHALALQNAHRYSTRLASTVSEVERSRCRRDQAFTAQNCRRAINGLYEECGGSGLMETSDLQRVWRDANAAAAHHGLTWDWQAENWARARFVEAGGEVSA